MSRVIISGGDVVLPDRVLSGGTVAVEDHRIVAIADRAYARSHHAQEQFIDASGRLVLPGLVDLHNDAFEAEINPRPRVNLPPLFALTTLDRRLIAAGVTTEFHAIFFANMVRSERTLAVAPQRVAIIREFGASGRALVDHHVQFRVDLWNPESLAAALEAAEGWPAAMLSLNDHTPGQGQYTNVENYKLYLREQMGRPEHEVEQSVNGAMQRAREQQEIQQAVLDRVRATHDTTRMTIVSHDDDTPDRVDEMYAVGARIGEFPVTFAAAEQQRRLGMTIVAGAPNIVRGGSTSGNTSAGDLLARGLVDVLCADYHAPSLLYAALLLARDGRLSLPDAVRLVTLNPARAAGLTTIGQLEPGKQADLIVVNPSDPAPVVDLVLRAGRVCHHVPSRIELASNVTRPELVAPLARDR